MIEASEAKDAKTLGAIPPPDLDGPDLARRFAEIKPTDGITVVKIKSLRQACLDCAVLISMTTPPSRERSIAITKLEEATLWAIKAATVGPLGTVEDMPHLPGSGAETLPHKAWMQISEDLKDDEGSPDVGQGVAPPAEADAPDAELDGDPEDDDGD